MIDALICGIGGKMGQNLLQLISAEEDIRTVCGVDISIPENANVPVYTAFGNISEHVDVIIDFSSPAVLNEELCWAEKHRCPVILAATGYSDKDLDRIEQASEKIAIFKTGNFSLGINLLVKLVKKAAEALGEKFDIEIIEKHHNLKADAPSGTALMLAESANSSFEPSKPYVCGRNGITGKRGAEIGMHAVRGGTIVGEHDVIFAGEDEVITLSHSARSKRIFAAGAIKAAKWIVGKPSGKYDMSNVFEDL